MAEQDANTGGASGAPELYFPFLLGACQSTAPPRSMSSPDGQFIWRDALNMVVRDGQLIGRPGINSGIGASAPGQPTLTNPSGGSGTAQLPLWVHNGLDLSGNTFCVVVTDSEIFIYYNGVWRNCTPTYVVGTITATNGSTAITGAATLWQTRGITAGVMHIDATDYTFVVTGEGTGTLGANYTGGTGAGKAYSIRRTFGNAYFSAFDKPATPSLFAEIYNNNLYVAVGDLVIKVSNIYSTSPTPGYITAGRALTATLDYIPGGLAPIVGLDILQDSRVVIASGTSVFYSSQLNDAVWTVAPAGNTYFAEVPGPLTGMGRIGDTRTIHHAGGIIRADQTGLSDPPLRFQASGAHVGTCSPRTIRPFRGGEAFLAIDGDVKLFDGNTVTSLGDHEMGYRTRQRIAAGSETGLIPSDYWAWVNSMRDEYVLLRLPYNLAADPAVYFWICQAEERSDLRSFTGRKLSGFVWWPCATATLVGALSATPPSTINQFPQVSATAGCRSDVGDTLRQYREDTADTTGTPTYYLETDDLDLGQPLAEKTPMRAILWSSVALSSIVITPREYGGSYTYPVTKNLSAGKPATFDFYPAVRAAITSSVAHRYKISGSDLRLGVFALLIREQMNGMVEHYGGL